MPSGLAERYDFFLSRRGSVAAIAREVTDVLLEKGYKVRVEDYDFRLGASFIEEMHEAIIRSRDLIILFTEDYLRLALHSEGVHQLRGSAIAQPRGAAHCHPAVRGCAIGRSARRRSISRPRGCRRA